MLAMLALTAAFAEVPVAPYPDCDEQHPELCMPDIPDNWELLSWVPDGSKDSVRPSELPEGSGIGADQAFRVETGRWDVTIAILDSGIEWDEGELIAKVRLNTAELPPPQRADGSEVADYDLDGNGLVNIWDYAEDARLDITAGDDVGDHWLDPSDLIYTFSDGVDSDGNGYVDDIAGWDFFGWDNNPYSVPGSTAYHGSGVMRDAAAEGGNGGNVGACPNCSILPLRLGDGFISEGDRITMAVAYAADNGASVIGMALGGLTLPDHTKAAFEYAHERGLVMVANPGDENSFHRNFPGSADPVFYMHSVRGENQNEDAGGVFSFQAFQNCNNYSPRLDLVASSDGCGTGSVARTSGSLGLLMSASRNHDLDLQPLELRGLLQSTAVDVNLSEADQLAGDAVPSHEGWDAYFGYGRIHLGRAIDAAIAGDIPPMARITSPAWFDWYSAEKIAIDGVVDAPRAGGVSWVLEAGTGLDPEVWTQIATGDGPVDGRLAEVDPAAQGWGKTVFGDLDGEDQFQRFERANEPLVTFRLTATDDAGRVTHGRRGVWVHDDPDLLPGWPLRLGSSAEASAAVADVDGDGIAEVIVAASDGAVHVVNGAGQALSGWPVRTAVSARLTEHAAAPAFASGDLPADLADGVLAAPAIGDIDGDGSPEIVVGTVRGGVHAWHADGTPVAGWPVAIEGRLPEEFQADMAYDDGVGAAPSLGDVDGDGAYEVVVAGMDQRLYVWNGDGTLRDGYPMELCLQCGVTGARILSSPSLGDIDGDGDLDAALGTNEIPVGDTGVLWVIDLGAAEVMDGYPMTRDGLVNQSILPVLGEGHPSTVALADLDGDGDLELSSFAMLGTTPPMHHDGTEFIDLGFAADLYGEASTFRDGSFLSMVTSPAFGDMDQDGTPDMALGGASVMWVVSLALSKVTEHDQAFGAWSLKTGQMMPGFPRQVEDIAFLGVPAIAEISGDVWPEAMYGTGGGLVHAWDFMGREADGWPKFTGGWILGAPATADIDGDGYLDVVISNRDGHVFAWRTKGSAAVGPEWAGMHHDPQNTSNYGAPLLGQAGPALESGGCCGGGGAADTAWLALPALGWMIRRRRRRQALDAA